METIKFKDNKALKLIRDLEDLNLIRVVDTTELKKPVTRFSDLLKSSISREQAENMQKELKKMRSEWERDTY